MTPKITISIGRQFGSGGRILGQSIAKRLGFKFYDNELISLAASEVGFDPSFFEDKDEKPSRLSFFSSVQHFFTPSIGQDMLSDAKIFEIQSKVIRDISAKYNCVIMGRCSDYILRDNPYCVSVFFWAPMADRIKRVCNRLNIYDEQEAERIISKADKERAEYYKYFTGKTWGKSTSYNVCVDVSMLGLERTIDFMIRLLKEKFGDLLL